MGTVLNNIFCNTLQFVHRIRRLLDKDDQRVCTAQFLRESLYLRESVGRSLRLLPARHRPQGLVVIGVCLSVCLSVCVSVCLCVRTVFVRKISQERVHGSPPNLVGGSRG